jgi:hypothetical protein
MIKGSCQPGAAGPDPDAPDLVLEPDLAEARGTGEPIVAMSSTTEARVVAGCNKMWAGSLPFSTSAASI